MMENEEWFRVKLSVDEKPHDPMNSNSSPHELDISISKIMSESRPIPAFCLFVNVNVIKEPLDAFLRIGRYEQPFSYSTCT